MESLHITEGNSLTSEFNSIVHNNGRSPLEKNLLPLYGVDNYQLLALMLLREPN